MLIMKEVNEMSKRNVLKSNKELQQILSKYPDDMKVVIGVESEHLGLGLFYDIVCGGLETSDMENITIVNMDAFKKSCMDVIDELF